MGSHKPSSEKPVRLQLWVKNINSWYKYLKENGLVNKEIHEGITLKIKTCTVKDPEGYSIEFCQFLTPYGE